MLRLFLILSIISTVYAEEALEKNARGLVMVNVTEEMLTKITDENLGTKIDPQLPPWTPQNEAIEGQLISMGSDYLNNMVTLWAETFIQEYPEYKVSIQGKGSTTAMPPLIIGSHQWVP